jgi:hypothetical protein
MRGEVKGYTIKVHMPTDYLASNHLILFRGELLIPLDEEYAHQMILVSTIFTQQKAVPWEAITNPHQGFHDVKRHH